MNEKAKAGLEQLAAIVKHGDDTRRWSQEEASALLDHFSSVAAGGLAIHEALRVLPPMMQAMVLAEARRILETTPKTPKGGLIQ